MQRAIASATRSSSGSDHTVSIQTRRATEITQSLFIASSTAHTDFFRSRETSCIQGPTKVIAADGAMFYYKRQIPLGKLSRRRTWIHVEIPVAIKAKKLCSDMRVCRLHSIVVDDDETLEDLSLASEEELIDGMVMVMAMVFWHRNNMQTFHKRKRLVGMLLHFIENKGRIIEEIMPWSDGPNEHRLRWATELEGIIKELHAAALVWGDAKLRNVLVDQNDQLRLINLERSFTRGWVDEVNEECKEGGWQGVERIKE